MRGRSKYNARRTTVDGVTFDSASEAQRWGELKLLQQAGVIHNLQRQVRYELSSQRGVKLGAIVIDFTYVQDGKPIAEDRKGMLLPLARWKLNHLAADYAFTVRITRKGKPTEEIAP